MTFIMLSIAKAGSDIFWNGFNVQFADQRCFTLLLPKTQLQ
jgi:hypothetical protein